MYRKILVPLDGSTLAESVLEHVQPIAQCMGAEIVLLRVVFLPVSAFIVASEPNFVVDTSEDLRAQALDYLNGIAATLRKAGIAVSVKTSSGVAGAAIQELATDLHADLIAMSTHGRGGLARWVIGSVADQLICHSKIPILLIRPAKPK